MTGAGGGINKVILTRLAEEGAKCVLVDINDEWGQALAATLRGRGLEVTYIQTDVRYFVPLQTPRRGSASSIEAASNLAGLWMPGPGTMELEV